MSWIEVVRNSVTTEDILNRYVGQPNRMKKYHCPFHNDKTPSLSINPKNGKFRCFSCGENGDGIDIVQRLFECTQREALEIIGRDFNLGLEDLKEDAQKVREARRKREEERRKEEDLRRRIVVQKEKLWAYRRIFRDGYERTKPKPGENMERFMNDERRVKRCFWFMIRLEWVLWLETCLDRAEYGFDLQDCPYHFEITALGEDPMLFTVGAKSEDLDRRRITVLEKLEKGEFDPCKIHKRKQSITT